MSKENNSELKFYYPKCKVKGCEGVLQIQFDEYNFSIICECEKNKEHIKNCLYFETFENFYLKEKSYQKCRKCNLNLENNCIYSCKQCDEIYCSSCFFYDEHIKKDINNINIKSKKCKIHNCELNNYCIDCGKKVCIFCLNNDFQNNPHKSHKVIYILGYMPTNNEINYLNEIVNKKIKFISSLIDSIEIWQKTFLNKIERLKNNLKSEIKLLKKMFSNFNQFFVDYSYYKNFKELKEVFNNIYLKKFYNSFNFKEKSKNLIEALFYNKSKFISKKAVLVKKCKLVDDLIVVLNDNYFFCNSDKNKSVDISYYCIEDNQIYSNSTIDFKEKIYSVSFSPEKNNIYACLYNQRVVKIFNLNTKNKLKLCEEEIKDIKLFSSHFNKCIFLTNDYVATSDNYNINIWKKNYNNKINYYSNRSEIDLNTPTYDLLLVDNEYFISSQGNLKTITFLDIKNFKIQKTLSKIDSIKSFNCLFLIKNYIIINCYHNLKVIYTKTKELIQVIEIPYELGNYKICVGNNNIYLLGYINKNLSVLKKELIDNSFILTEEYKIIETDNNFFNEESSIISSNNLNIIYNNGFIIILGKSFYLLKEKINNNWGINSINFYYKK